MIERIKFVGTVMCWHAGLLFCFLMLRGLRFNQDTYARMNGTYLPKPYDHFLDAAWWILCTPLVLLSRALPAHWAKVMESSWIGHGLNLYIYVMILYCGRVWFEKMKAR